MATGSTRVSQYQKPRGWLGRYTLWRMNLSHSKLTDWGLGHLSVSERAMILDVGCGGGKTVSKLAATATEGRVYGVDFSEESVAVSKKTNAGSIAAGRVEIRQASVSQLPFPDGMFDLVTAVETHFWWPDLPGDTREIFRVVKAGGKLILIAEIYKGANTLAARLAEKYADGSPIKLLSVEEHRDLLRNAGFTEIQVVEERAKGWICAFGRKPSYFLTSLPPRFLTSSLPYLTLPAAVTCRPARADSYPIKAGWPFRFSRCVSPGSTMTIWAENFVREA